MHVYSGIGRRQVGGNIWSTIQRGLRPLLMKLKPLAIKAGKRAAGSALNVGTSIASDALTGKLSKAKLKNAMKQEVDKLKSEVVEKGLAYKRKYLDNLQSGSGAKRRRIQKPTPKKKMPARKVTKKRKTIKRKSNKKTTKVYKRKQVRKPSKSISRKSKAIKRSKRRTVSRKAIADIFGK